ncbi:uncharacterized protein IL334_005565 [Kwoniella shivajii]|uniref:Phospholipase/carboxylesterase/thioesterase domain-containing protein n=1 Tax=Kwoniella shivajii TaxID=564305 RepID=A0ABZ1D3H8_9TREE|nr:hypothetical protein IL334_005565 [Kwoniella shivajii]
MTSLNLRPVASSSSASSSSASSSKPIPSPASLKPWDFAYSSSSDGCDTNLLIMFHGLGDSKTPFFNLAKQLNLPSTAILSLSAIDPIPLMDHPSFSWYPTFTSTYDPIPIANQNPTVHLSKLRDLVSTLITPSGHTGSSAVSGGGGGGLGWKLDEIHLFGWGQGGTIALELGLSIGKNPLTISTSAVESEGKGGKRFGSITSICANLLTHPTSSLNIPTPVCYFTRTSPKSSIHEKSVNVLKRAFREVQIVTPKGSGGGGEDMPRSKDDWYGIMKFWSQVLGRKSDEDKTWKGQGEVYEVIR